MKCIHGLVWILAVTNLSLASAGTLVEDFSSLNHADLSNSSGVWDIINHQARAQAFADSDATRPIRFGDGSDGAVNTGSGYIFDTDSHPLGYQFQSLSITGGAVTIRGSHPLVIRSLSTITITPPLQANGGNGGDGLSTGAVPSGGLAVTCEANGGRGGSASASTALSGEAARLSDGSADASPPGTGQVGGSYTASSGIVDAVESSSFPAGTDFDSNPNADFLCGASGAGGGGYTVNSGSPVPFASGGGGGAGGGVMQLVAIGDIALGVLEAKGGNGGNGITVVPGGAGVQACSGIGMGGFGGVVFLQTLGNLSAPIAPDVSGGIMGSSGCNPGGSLLAGFAREDLNSTAPRPAWATLGYSTDLVPANLQSMVQSGAYDLGVLNASFSAETVTSSGNVSMTYSGSADGESFSDFTTDLASLSNQGYRFLKFRATFTNPAGGGAAPELTKLNIPYTDSGLASLDAKLYAGCGTLAMSGTKMHRKSSSRSDAAGMLFTGIAFLLAFAMSRIRFEKIRAKYALVLLHPYSSGPKRYAP